MASADYISREAAITTYKTFGHLNLHNAIEAFNEIPAADVRPRWISVEERLPEHGWYLAYGPTIKMEVLHFHSVEEVWSSERYYNIEVTHWMPLPEPPKEE